MKLLFIKLIGSLVLLYCKLFKESSILIISHDNISQQYDSVYSKENDDEDRTIELARLLYSSFDIHSNMKKAAEISLTKIYDDIVKNIKEENFDNK
jgi:hypothetical protein